VEGHDPKAPVPLSPPPCYTVGERRDAGSHRQPLAGGRDAEDLLTKSPRFLQERSGGSEGRTPTVPHEELRSRESEALPERPDELSKRVLAISRRGQDRLGRPLFVSP
jgi:hypothetical protein